MTLKLYRARRKLWSSELILQVLLYMGLALKSFNKRKKKKNVYLRLLLQNKDKQKWYYKKHYILDS